MLFISLSADDVALSGCGCFRRRSRRVAAHPRVPASPRLQPGTSFYIHGYSGGAQTAAGWKTTLAAAAPRTKGIDWIIVQMHQDALSSSKVGNGSDRGIREAWLPLFDRYQRRPGPLRARSRLRTKLAGAWPAIDNVGKDAATGATVDTCQPNPVMTAALSKDGAFDTSHGTIHLILGGGGTSVPCDVYGTDPVRAAIRRRR